MLFGERRRLHLKLDSVLSPYSSRRLLLRLLRRLLAVLESRRRVIRLPQRCTGLGVLKHDASFYAHCIRSSAVSSGRQGFEPVQAR